MQKKKRIHKKENPSIVHRNNLIPLQLWTWPKADSAWAENHLSASADATTAWSTPPTLSSPNPPPRSQSLPTNSSSPISSHKACSNDTTPYYPCYTDCYYACPRSCGDYTGKIPGVSSASTCTSFSGRRTACCFAFGLRRSNGWERLGVGRLRIGRTARKMRRFRVVGLRNRMI